jgi:hypothetical protein
MFRNLGIKFLIVANTTSVSSCDTGNTFVLSKLIRHRVYRTFNGKSWLLLTILLNSEYEIYRLKFLQICKYIVLNFYIKKICQRITTLKEESVIQFTVSHKNCMMCWKWPPQLSTKICKCNSA